MFVCMYGNCLACLTVDMESGAVLPLGTLYTDMDCQNSGTPDTAVIGSYQCYDYPTPYIPVSMGVGLPPLGGNLA